METVEEEIYNTGVCFRIFPTGEVIALFTQSFRDGSCNSGLCMSYMHVGQHGEADPRHLMNYTRPVKTGEDILKADALKRELQSIGYHFTRVYKKFPYRS